jgi:hypothetical protein
MAKNSRHVVATRDGGWGVRRYGAARSGKVFRTQADAVSYATDVARRERTELYVHQRDGSIQQKINFGVDAGSQQR